MNPFPIGMMIIGIVSIFVVWAVYELYYLQNQ